MDPASIIKALNEAAEERRKELSEMTNAELAEKMYDILVCDNLEETEVFDDFKFAREEKHDNAEAEAKTITELMNEELDVSKEMEILKKAYNKYKKK